MCREYKYREPFLHMRSAVSIFKIYTKSDLYFWASLDRICHTLGHLEARYVWAWRVCQKLADVSEKYDDWRFL